MGRDKGVELPAPLQAAELLLSLQPPLEPGLYRRTGFHFRHWSGFTGGQGSTFGTDQGTTGGQGSSFGTGRGSTGGQGSTFGTGQIYRRTGFLSALIRALPEDRVPLLALVGIYRRTGFHFWHWSGIYRRTRFHFCTGRDLPEDKVPPSALVRSTGGQGSTFGTGGTNSVDDRVAPPDHGSCQAHVGHRHLRKSDFRVVTEWR
ncbi:hypothetical protein Hamer_G015582 [Homarus americanus]|uniref:Uncharacterized protein n=1 Tax=Homarus americanus TaxID=6706 RepID=A0A8J5JE69_HOMAM|nr:hypothetical protein Hamer_G015582 [Homarus americanus]